MRITRLLVKPGHTPADRNQRAHRRCELRCGRVIKQWTTPPPDMLQWLDKGTSEEFAVTGDFPVDIIKIDFLTKPR